jgi:YhcH/YjgK/YiaL family protein
MILDTLSNSKLYESVHPRFKKAFEYLRNTDLKSLPLGKIELEGSNLLVNVVDITGKPASEARMETHRKFIDIQVPVGNTETMGWLAAENLKNPTAPYDAEKDITFFTDKASVFIPVQPYEFAVFFPEDGHQPGIAEGVYRKIIVKVLV